MLKGNSKKGLLLKIKKVGKWKNVSWHIWKKCVHVEQNDFQVPKIPYLILAMNGQLILVKIFEVLMMFPGPEPRRSD